MKILEYINGDVVVEYNNNKYVRLHKSDTGLCWQTYECYKNNIAGFILRKDIEVDFKIALRKYKIDSL